MDPRVDSNSAVNGEQPENDWSSAPTNERRFVMRLIHLIDEESTACF